MENEGWHIWIPQRLHGNYFATNLIPGDAASWYGAIVTTEMHQNVDDSDSTQKWHLQNQDGLNQMAGMPNDNYYVTNSIAGGDAHCNGVILMAQIPHNIDDSDSAEKH